MKIIKTGIEGLVILEPRIFEDSRGYFFESYSQREFEEKVCEITFLQDNESKSSYGVMRGLHFQKPPFAQSKLVRCVKGTVLDVAVDIRKDSLTYGKHVSVELTESNHRQFFIPKGFAHGFAVLSEIAVFQYKYDEFYHPESDNSIIGPVGTLKRLLSNQDFFNSKGYDLTVFTDDSLSFGPFKEPPTERNAISTNRKGLRRLISSAVVKLARKSLLLSCLLINRDRKKVKKLIDYYISLRRTPDIIEFHSCYECSFYLENRLENNAKTVMFLHSDGIPFKMEMEYYPHLKGSKYLQKLLDEFLLNCFYSKYWKE